VKKAYLIQTYLARKSSNTSTVSVFKTSGTVKPCNHKLRTVFGSIGVAWFLVRPEPRLDCRTNATPLEYIRRISKAGCPIASVVLPFDACDNIKSIKFNVLINEKYLPPISFSKQVDLVAFAIVIGVMPRLQHFPTFCSQFACSSLVRSLNILTKTICSIYQGFSENIQIATTTDFPKAM
jgi:hypothetical protein